MDSSGFDRRKALEQQIKLLELKREHLDNLINFARGIKATGVRNLSFKAFDTSKIDEYARKTKEAYGNTMEYKEFQEKLRLERSISQIQDQLEDERLTDRKQVLAEELSRAQDRVKALNVCIAEIGQTVTERRGRTIRLIHEN